MLWVMNSRWGDVAGFAVAAAAFLIALIPGWFLLGRDRVVEQAG